MRILRLERLLPGDVILETGHPQIARATGGLYGHASVALGKLVKLEAENSDGGVVLNPFGVSAWHRASERVVGVLVNSENVVVLRKIGLDVAEVDGEALWEAGRRYSLSKLLELPDLDPEYRPLIERLRNRQSMTADESQGRFCSEVAARILALPEPHISPNALAASGELEVVSDAIEELGEGWVEQPIESTRAALATLVAQVRLGLAQLATEEAIKTAQEISLKGIAQEEAVNKLDHFLTGKIADSINVLQEIRELEPTILHTHIDPV